MTTKIELDIKAIAPFSFDGHGINDANGQRITKVTSCDPYIYPNGQAVRNAEFDRLSTLFATAPELLEALERTLIAWQDDSMTRDEFCLLIGDVLENQWERAIRKAKGE